MLDFDSDPLTFDHALIFTKKRWKSAKSNPIFHWKGTKDRVLILTYLDSMMAEFFSSFFYFPQFRPSSGGNRGSKLDQKCKLWVSPVSVKI